MLRLMIVDDEQIIREALSEMIDYESIGYQLIATARNGMEAYDIICDEYPDVIIADIQMPVLNGLELIEYAVKTDSQVTFILLSGYNDFAYAKQAMKFGVRHYLLKPTDKEELTEALVAVRKEHAARAEHQKEEHSRLLLELRQPLEQCFLIEALEYADYFPKIFKKFQSLLDISKDCQTACICSFVETGYLKRFVREVQQYLDNRSLSLQFPVIYVKNSVIFIFKIPTLQERSALQTYLEQIQYPEQAVSFEACFLHFGTSLELFRNVLAKVSRYEQIYILNHVGESYTIRHHIASPSQIDRLNSYIQEAADSAQASDVLMHTFTDHMPLDSARNIALGLFLKANPLHEQPPLDVTCDFFRKLYSCLEISHIRELMHAVIFQSSIPVSQEKRSSNISLLKAYVQQNFQSETLSLKWIADNYLFVSVGYLSKQFVKEEGIRFSDYLNRIRMEEAKRLMEFYHNANILSIADQVGFGNNPQYFRQVFKRYTGYTPSNYLKKLSL